MSAREDSQQKNFRSAAEQVICSTFAIVPMPLVDWTTSVHIAEDPLQRFFYRFSGVDWRWNWLRLGMACRYHNVKSPMPSLTRMSYENNSCCPSRILCRRQHGRSKPRFGSQAFWPAHLCLSRDCSQSACRPNVPRQRSYIRKLSR